MKKKTFNYFLFFNHLIFIIAFVNETVYPNHELQLIPIPNSVVLEYRPFRLIYYKKKSN